MVGPGPSSPSLSESRAGGQVLRAGHKRFFFDLGSNVKGDYLRITEVCITCTSIIFCQQSLLALTLLKHVLTRKWPLNHTCTLPGETHVMLSVPSPQLAALPLPPLSCGRCAGSWQRQVPADSPRHSPGTVQRGRPGVCGAARGGHGYSFPLTRAEAQAYFPGLLPLQEGKAVSDRGRQRSAWEEFGDRKVGVSGRPPPGVVGCRTAGACKQGAAFPRLKEHTVCQIMVVHMKGKV